MNNDRHVIEEAFSNLKYHFDQYKKYKYNSKTLSRKADRERAERNMNTSSTYIENLLTRHPLVNIIRDGNPFQFEDFWRYVESDLPGYILKIENHLAKIDKIQSLFELSEDDNHTSEINIEKITQAKEITSKSIKNTKDLLMLLVSMNLINAALKRKEFQSKDEDALIYYGMLKPKVTDLFKLLLTESEKFDVDFYINPVDKCAYIEIEGFQFSFHNISIDDVLQNFIDSEINNPKPWKGIRLQKIAGELFDFIVN